MNDPASRQIGTPLSKKEAAQYYRLRDLLFEFAGLFDYAEPSDRSVAIVGPAFLDTLLTEMLIGFLVEDDKEVSRLLRPEGPLGTFGAKISACYCPGLIGDTVKADLRIVAKVRNRFAHHLRAAFADAQIDGWCKALRWHREAHGEPPKGATARDLFQVGVNQFVCDLNGLVGVGRLDKRGRFDSESTGARRTNGKKRGGERGLR